MQQLITWSQGNPGALTFLMELLHTENIPRSISIMSKLEELTSIRGTNLYVLWSDLCGKDLKVVEQLCKNCPDEILVDACSRQDYSGRELVKPYL
jgi:hypothetical protein